MNHNPAEPRPQVDSDDEFRLAEPLPTPEEETAAARESSKLNRFAETAADELPPDEPNKWYQPAEETPTQYSVYDLLVVTLAGAIGLTFGRMMGGQILAFVTGTVATVLLVISLVKPPQSHWGQLLIWSLLLMYGCASLALVLQAGT